MENLQFTINGETYQAVKLDAFKQFHLSRKIAPVIPTLFPVFVEISKQSDLAANMDKLALMLQPFADALANLSDEHSEYVLKTCLSAVRRQVGDKWMPVWSDAQKVCMFDDMDLGVMVQVSMNVIQDSLGGFIQGLLMSQASNPTNQTTA
jgi:hypothetical protein